MKKTWKLIRSKEKEKWRDDRNCEQREIEDLQRSYSDVINCASEVESYLVFDTEGLIQE